MERCFVEPVFLAPFRCACRVVVVQLSVVVLDSRGPFFFFLAILAPLCVTKKIDLVIVLPRPRITFALPSQECDNLLCASSGLHPYIPISVIRLPNSIRNFVPNRGTKSPKFKLFCPRYHAENPTIFGPIANRKGQNTRIKSQNMGPLPVGQNPNRGGRERRENPKKRRVSDAHQEKNSRRKKPQ